MTKQTQIESNSLDEDDEDEFSYNEDISEVDTLNEVTNPTFRFFLKILH